MIHPFILIRKRIIPIQITDRDRFLILYICLLVIGQQNRLIQPAVIILCNQLILKIRALHLDIRNALV